MAFPDVSTVLDDFNRANVNPLDGSWANGWFGDGNCKIVSNVLNGADGVGGGWFSARYTGATYGPDCVWFFSTPGNCQGMYVAAHLDSNQGSPSGYSVGINSTTGRIMRIDGGAETDLGATYSTTMAAGDKFGIRITVSGGVATIEHWRFNGGSWSQIATRTDSTYLSAGYFAFDANEQSTAGLASIDDASGGTISAGGAVYSKSNTGTAPATASGADQAVWVEQGKGTAAAAGSGAKNFLTNKPGTAAAPHTASGGDQSVWVEQGTGTATATSSGADNFVTADSGTATAPAVASGADQTVFVEQGTGTATAAGSGTDNFLTADSGAGTSTATANGADQTVWVETGTATSPFSASGASQLLHPGGNVYDKTGTGTLTTTASGDTSIVWAEAGTGAAPGTAGGDLGTHGGMGSWVPFADIYMGGPDGSVKVSHGEPIGLPTEERWRRERAAEREQERAQARLDEENLIELLMLL